MAPAVAAAVAAAKVAPSSRCSGKKLSQLRERGKPCVKTALQLANGDAFVVVSFLGVDLI